MNDKLLNSTLAAIFAMISFLFILSLPSVVQATNDFLLVPTTTKSASSPGYYGKIPLEPMPVIKGKLNFEKRSGYSYIEFIGDFDEKTNLITGEFSGADEYDNNRAYLYYCQFQAKVDFEKKTAHLVYYPGYTGKDDQCYAMIVFDIAKNSRGPRDPWWPDDLQFAVEPLERTGLEDSGARFSAIYGEVYILLPTGYDANGEPIFEDEEGWNFAKLDMELPYGAKIKLKERSGITVSFPDFAPYEMKTPDNMDADDETIIMLPLKPKGGNVLKLMGGQLYNNIKKIIKDGSMEIEMGQAAAGIKGTTFVLEERNNLSTLKVFEGEVEFRSRVDNKIELVKAGEMITADSSGLGNKTTFDLASEESKWNYLSQKTTGEATSEESKDQTTGEVTSGESQQDDEKDATPREGQPFIGYIGWLVGLGVLGLIFAGATLLLQRKKK